MLLKAAKDWNIDLKNSFMIGDGDRDVQAGENAGVKQSVRIEQNEPDALLKAVKSLL
jgi:histidinol phosphatase-like enzyme